MNKVWNRVKLLAVAAPLAATMVLPMVGVAHADERDFTLVNNTSGSMTELYVGPSTSAEWGDDLLNGNTIGSGNSVPVVFNGFNSGTCVYDVLTVYDTGAKGELDGIDLCSIDTVTFSDAG